MARLSRPKSRQIQSKSHDPSQAENQQSSSSSTVDKGGRRSSRLKPEVKQESQSERPLANMSKKRKRADAAASKKEEVDVKHEEDMGDIRPSPKRNNTKKKASKGPSEKDMQAGADMARAFQAHRDAQRDEPSPQREARQKNNSYGLSPGVSPFPKYARPTPEDCQEVKDILAKEHGDISAPKTIPKPSLNSSGCGEVPSVLDALVRTRLSAATNNANSSRAFRGLVEKFGIIEDGIGKGSVHWNKVRLAPQRDIFEAIKTGGLAEVKSRDIKNILNMVHEENQERRKNLEKNQKGATEDAQQEDESERNQEVLKAQNDVLSLDHLHLLSSEDAFQKLVGYPGIGPKTASCVLLFCMQRPSFAVDTHVFRLTKWLGWVPTDAKAKAMANAEAKESGTKAKSATVTREKTYAHLDVRIPDELKYPLHYLLIKHGKNCGWCSAKAGAAAKVGTCPLAHLMSGKGKNKGLAKKAKMEEGNEDTESEEDEIDDNEEEEAEEEDDQEFAEATHGIKVEK